MNDFKIEISDGITIFKEYTGNDYTLALPDAYEGNAITCIGAKSFLSCKSVVELSLPAATATIESWAFAHMRNLSRLTVPCNNITLGKEVFLDCNSLTAINIIDDTSENPGTPFFLADAVIRLQNLSLFSPKLAGSFSQHQEWMAQYDEALYHFICQPDDAGFQPVFYGWFNDEDAELTQRPAYIKARQENKIELLFTRLLYPKHLSDSHRAFFSEYITSKMSAVDSVDSIVWHLYCTKHLDDLRYLDVLLQTGCCTPDNIPYLIQDLKDKNPEVTAKLLNYQMEHLNTQDSFDEFEL